MGEESLDDRARHLLNVLVSHYIKEGKPIGSRTLSRQSGLDLSPATIRNVMADLEESGLIRAPHTSAGRVPTHQGYRFFVDTLVTADPTETYTEVASGLAEEREGGTTDTVKKASSVLSALTSLVGVVTVPKRDSFAFRHIDFVALSSRQVLAILVFADGEVQNRLLNTDQEFSPVTLERAANYLNSEFSGLKLPQIKRRLVEQMAQARGRMDELMAAAIDVAASAFSGGAENKDMVVRGEANLLQYRDMSDLESLRSLFEAFQQKREILYLLDECVSADGVRLFIGEESGTDALGNCSLVSAPYQVDDEVVGVVGVIGPTRMAYDRAISVVQATADVLSSLLNQPR